MLMITCHLARNLAAIFQARNQVKIEATSYTPYLPPSHIISSFRAEIFILQLLLISCILKNPPTTSTSRSKRIFTFAQESENKHPSDNLTIYPHNIRTQRRREYLDTQHATDSGD